MPKRWWIYPLFALCTVLLAMLLLVAYAAVIVYPTLPSLEALTEYNPKIPLRIFSADSALIGEFGEERRAVIKIAEVPTSLKQAIVAAEDTARHKPEPDVFLEAARRLGAEPAACTVYEDTDIGLEAARRAGMTPVDVRPIIRASAAS